MRYNEPIETNNAPEGKTMQSVKVIYDGKTVDAEVMSMWEWARREKEARANRK